ncbi:hypothetical protein V6N11_042440 [Hibiscus sabdariffa]|uniref:Uncharacterized protein n=1 Tax=Hibiscus sabdariffa TaxID=183260 RepID=A0ABR2QWD2_9ROSI
MNISKMRALFAILCILTASTLFIPAVSMAGGRRFLQRGPPREPPPLRCPRVDPGCRGIPGRPAMSWKAQRKVVKTL